MRYYENGNLYSYLDESMGVLCWRDIVDMLWAISAGLNFIHERVSSMGIYMEGTPSIVSGTPPVFARLMLQCLDADPFNRPTVSQLYERLGNWVTAICDPSDLSNQFNVAEEINFIKFSNTTMS
ncbi:hypothetical protein RhiirC2_858565 [Rhizophagus irregularis]|uniref:Protein kinase domain-containing protein n=1 Tax=Rhizophagus irregularis TaxID=588596 RepID=A0A2N1M4H5_9GLOM|nr:hypothetical protein RhiirC2_858565 [Rhizophagus irregularis]